MKLFLKLCCVLLLLGLCDDCLLCDGTSHSDELPSALRKHWLNACHVLHTVQAGDIGRWKRWSCPHSSPHLEEMKTIHIVIVGLQTRIPASGSDFIVSHHNRGVCDKRNVVIVVKKLKKKKKKDGINACLLLWLCFKAIYEPLNFSLTLGRYETLSIT